jgi:hypothetical protein
VTRLSVQQIAGTDPIRGEEAQRFLHTIQRPAGDRFLAHSERLGNSLGHRGQRRILPAMVSNNRKARPRTSGSILAGLMRPITQPLQARLLVRANTAYLCSATLNSLINGVSRISRNNCQASAGDESHASPDAIHL